MLQAVGVDETRQDGPVVSRRPPPPRGPATSGSTPPAACNTAPHTTTTATNLSPASSQWLFPLRSAGWRECLAPPWLVRLVPAADGWSLSPTVSGRRLVGPARRSRRSAPIVGLAQGQHPFLPSTKCKRPVALVAGRQCGTIARRGEPVSTVYKRPPKRVAYWMAVRTDAGSPCSCFVRRLSWRSKGSEIRTHPARPPHPHLSGHCVPQPHAGVAGVESGGFPRPYRSCSSSHCIWFSKTRISGCTISLAHHPLLSTRTGAAGVVIHSGSTADETKLRALGNRKYRRPR